MLVKLFILNNFTNIYLFYVSTYLNARQDKSIKNIFNFQLLRVLGCCTIYLLKSTIRTNDR